MEEKPMNCIVIMVNEGQLKCMMSVANAHIYLPQLGGLLKLEPLEDRFAVFAVNAYCDRPHLAYGCMTAVARAGDRVVICLCEEENPNPTCSHE